MYVGIDYHKRYAVATSMDETSMDEKGRIIEQVRLNNKPDDLIGLVDRLPAQSKIALEATGNWYYFYIRSIALSTEKTQLLGRYHTESLNYAVVW